jgi:hypothetical protein
MAALAHKGKPSEFFWIKRDAEGFPILNFEQKTFVWVHYVNYSDPEDMVSILDWLYDVA